jgi:filamentous hemagglutinin family protein
MPLLRLATLAKPSQGAGSIVAAAAVCLLPLMPLAAESALPQGGRVVAGAAQIAAPTAKGLTIRQTSQTAVIDWTAFDIGSGRSVTFDQRSATDEILNRVTGSTPSSIAGTIKATGRVYLVNPNRITITPSGRIVTGKGFVASSLDIAPGDFKAGKRTFVGRGASAAVRNHGAISTGEGGLVALIGGTVANSGTIDVPFGKVGMGSGERITLDPNGDGFLQVAVPTAPNGKPLIDAAGKVTAKGGRIELSAATVRDVVRDAVNVPGSLQARSVGGRNGAIVLRGGPGGRVSVAGRLDVSGTDGAGTIAISGRKVDIGAGSAAQLSARSRSGRGGAITVTADDTVTIGRARLDVSGGAGGGDIRIGGDWQGGGTLPHAATVLIGTDARLNADATANGTGGRYRRLVRCLYRRPG